MSDDLKYRLPLFGDRVTWGQYCQRYVTLDWNEPVQRCLALAGQRLPRTELETLAAELETASARYDSTDGYFALCDIRRRLGDLTGSIAAIQRARSHEPRWWHYAARHAQVLIAAGDFEQALAIAEDVVTFHPEAADGRMALSEAYYRLGRMAEALQEARAALAAAPGHPHVMTRLAQLESESAGTPHMVARDVSTAVGAE